MKLMQLNYFKTACEYSNISKAAEALHISQPSISTAIKELENEFGVPLLNRSTKGFSLTQEGYIFLELVNDLLKNVDSIVETMHDLGNKRNLIRIGVPPMIGYCLFPKMYAHFHKTYPEINVQTREYGTHSILDALNNNLLDVAIVPSNDIDRKKYHILPITETITVYCVSKDHKYAGLKNISTVQLKDEPLIMFGDDFYQNDYIKAEFSNNGVIPKVILKTNQISTILNIISNNIATGFLFKEIVNDHPDLVGIPFEKPSPVKISLVWRNNTHLFNDAEKFISYFKRKENLSFLL